MTSAEDDWKKSYKDLQKIKDDLKDCVVCGCPITKRDYASYKMCPWCYSESVFDNKVGEV